MEEAVHCHSTSGALCCLTLQSIAAIQTVSVFQLNIQRQMFCGRCFTNIDYKQNSKELQLEDDFFFTGSDDPGSLSCSQRQADHCQGC